jgi:hypothetical protein
VGGERATWSAGDAGAGTSGVTPTLRGLTVGDEPGAWRAAGFDVEDDRCDVGGVTLHLVGVHRGRGILGWSLDPAIAHVVDGLTPADARATPSPDGPAPDDRRSSSEHPNRIDAIDHLVVATPDVDRTTRALEAIGTSARRTIDGARGDADVRYRFFRLGPCVLELIGPVEPSGDGPARFVGLAFSAPSLDGLGPHASDPRDAVQPGRRIVTVRTRELGISVPVAVLTPRR